MFDVFLQAVIVLFSILSIRMFGSGIAFTRGCAAITQLLLQPVWVVLFIFSENYFVVLLSLVYGVFWYHSAKESFKIATRQGFHFGLKRKFISEYLLCLKEAFDSILADLQETVQKFKD